MHTFGDLQYFPETGEFWWTRPGVSRNVYKPAGHKGERYWHLHIDGEQFFAHRVAWFIMKGRWPIEIDHINRNGHDNRWINLREVTRSMNMANRSGWGKYPKYVYASGTGYRLMKKIDGKFKTFGSYKTVEEAVLARTKFTELQA